MFEPGGLAEITDLSYKLNIVNAGLRPLAALLLGVKVSKNAQMSNWENPVLTAAQVQYAAMDAWIGLQLYLKMKEMLLEESNEPNTSPTETEKKAPQSGDLPLVSMSGPALGHLPELEYKTEGIQHMEPKRIKINLVKPTAKLQEKSPISVLNELHPGVEYELASSAGPSNAPVFAIRASLNGVSFEGSGKSKKEAKHNAAKALLENLHLIAKKVGGDPK